MKFLLPKYLHALCYTKLTVLITPNRPKHVIAHKQLHSRNSGNQIKSNQIKWGVRGGGKRIGLKEDRQTTQ